MQIRELSLKELDLAYEMVQCEYADLSYDDFEDLIYEMQREEYKMVAALERGKIVGYMGLKIKTDLRHKRHLRVCEFICDESVKDELEEYLSDYARIALCKEILRA